MKQNLDRMIMASRIIAAGSTRPSYHGIRKDKKICEAKPGECRGNINHYTSGMRDEKSWSLPKKLREFGSRHGRMIRRISMKDSKGNDFLVGSILSLIDGPEMKCIKIDEIVNVGVFEWGKKDKKGNWFPSANRDFEVSQETINRSEFKREN